MLEGYMWVHLGVTVVFVSAAIGAIHIFVNRGYSVAFLSEIRRHG